MVTMDSNIKVTLNWENKDKNLLYFDENETPIWGDLNSISNRKMIEQYYYRDQTGLSNSSNMLIKGDNLLALLKLKDTFKNKIKCVYIDPPLIQVKPSITILMD